MVLIRLQLGFWQWKSMGNEAEHICFCHRVIWLCDLCGLGCKVHLTFCLPTGCAQEQGGKPVTCRGTMWESERAAVLHPSQSGHASSNSIKEKIAQVAFVKQVSINQNTIKTSYQGYTFSRCAARKPLQPRCNEPLMAASNAQKPGSHHPMLCLSRDKWEPL